MRKIMTVLLGVAFCACGSGSQKQGLDDTQAVADAGETSAMVPDGRQSLPDIFSPGDLATDSDHVSGDSADMPMDTESPGDLVTDAPAGGDLVGDQSLPGPDLFASGDVTDQTDPDQSGTDSADSGNGTQSAYKPEEWVMCTTDADCVSALGAGATCDRSVFPGGLCRGCNIVTDLCPKLALGKVWNTICHDFGNCIYLYDPQLGCPPWLAMGQQQIDGVSEQLCGLRKCSSTAECAPYECRFFSQSTGDACQQPQ